MVRIRRAAVALAVCLSTVIPVAGHPAQVSQARAGLALRDYVAQVLAAHPALLAAKAEVDAARAQMRADGRPLYNPELKLDYDNALDNGTRLGVSQRFNVVGKRKARKDVGAASLRVAESRYRILRKQLTVELLTILARYQAARDRLALADNRVSINKEFLAIAEQRWKEGDIPQSSLLTAQLALAEAQAARSPAENRCLRMTGTVFRVPAMRISPSAHGGDNPCAKSLLPEGDKPALSGPRVAPQGSLFVFSTVWGSERRSFGR